MTSDEALAAECSREDREAVFAAACFVAYADGRLWREAPRLRAIRRELQLRAARAQRIKARIANGRRRPPMPVSEPARRLAFQYALQMAVSDGKVDEAEQAAIDRLAAGLELSSAEVQSKLAQARAEVSLPRSKQDRPGAPDYAQQLAGLVGADAGRAVSHARFSLGFLIAANLVPLIGVLFFEWETAGLVLLYWAENLVIGFYGILRLATIRFEEPVEHLSKLFSIPFFCVHFGGFCGIHGMLVMGMFGLDSPGAVHMTWWGPFVFLQLLATAIQNAWQHLPPGSYVALVSLLASHGVSYVQNFLLGGERRRIEPGTAMALPYARIVPLHIAIIFGGMLVMLLGSPVALLVVLIALKSVLDTVLHLAAHRSLGELRPGRRGR